MKPFLLFLITLLVVIACQPERNSQSSLAYFEPADSAGVQAGGVKMIPVKTPAGDFRVWTKRMGNNPRIKVLLLHGGPAMTHEYMECFESFFPKEGIEFYEYDQLGSYYSDQPKDTSLWHTARFVEEVEQVRKALILTRTTSISSEIRGEEFWPWNMRSSISKT